MIVKLNEIKSRKELESFIAISGRPLFPEPEIYKIQSNNLAKGDKLSSDSYRMLLGLDFYIDFPEKETKEIIERIPLDDLEFKTCMSISEKHNIPFLVIAGYKTFLMQIQRAIDLEGEIPNTKVNDSNIIDTCVVCCKERIDMLINGCVPHEVLY